jgi:lysyl-tRNA synthetase class I
MSGCSNKTKASSAISKMSEKVFLKLSVNHVTCFKHQHSWGRCHDHKFLRFLPIFGEKIGVFLKNQCYDQNIFKIITSVPGKSNKVVHLAGRTSLVKL